MLAHVVQRTLRCPVINEVVVATTVLTRDDPIIDECRRLGLGNPFRGSESDVLDRYYWAAKQAHADCVVRITSDCPLIDPEVIGEALQLFMRAEADYVSNTLTRTYPRGLDAEVISHDALSRAWREAKERHQREHVTPYLYEHPKLFRIACVETDFDFSELRWTVDTEEDLTLLRAIHERLSRSVAFSWKDVLNLMWREPELAAINAHIQQKSFKDTSVQVQPKGQHLP